VERFQALFRRKLRFGLLSITLSMSSTFSHAQSTGWPSPGLAMADEPAASGRLLGVRLPFSGLDASSDSYGRAYSLRMKPVDRGRVTAAIEGRLAPRGPIGSLGLQTARDGPEIPAYDLNSAAAMGLRGEDAKIGARISYHF
jgi:hypothetical protein